MVFYWGVQGGAACRWQASSADRREAETAGPRRGAFSADRGEAETRSPKVFMHPKGAQTVLSGGLGVKPHKRTIKQKKGDLGQIDAFV